MTTSLGDDLKLKKIRTSTLPGAAVMVVATRWTGFFPSAVPETDANPVSFYDRERVGVGRVWSSTLANYGKRSEFAASIGHPKAPRSP